MKKIAEKKVFYPKKVATKKVVEKVVKKAK